MSSQLILLNDIEFKNNIVSFLDNPIKKRIHYKIPHFKNVYSVYQYDRKKYTEIWKKVRKLAIKFDNPDIFFRVSAYSVLRHCYIKKNNEFKKLCDEKHIFRYKKLHNIYDEIAQEILQGQNLLPFDGFILKKDGLNIYLNVYNEEFEWYDDKIKNYKKFKGSKYVAVSAEIEGTENLPLAKRLKIHIELLRLLRQSIKIKKAVKNIKKKFKLVS